MKNKIIIISIIIVIGVLYSNLLYAPPFAPPDGGVPTGDPVGAPIDGGISALIAGGAALVARKYRKNKKAKQEENEK